MTVSIASEALGLEVVQDAFLAQFGFPPPGDSGKTDTDTLTNMARSVEVTMLMCGGRLHQFLRECPEAVGAIRIIKGNLEQRLALVKLFPSLRPAPSTISLMEATLQEAERVLSSHPGVA